MPTANTAVSETLEIATTRSIELSRVGRDAGGPSWLRHTKDCTYALHP
jgi:hypothetical protein